MVITPTASILTSDEEFLKPQDDIDGQEDTQADSEKDSLVKPTSIGPWIIRSLGSILTVDGHKDTERTSRVVSKLEMIQKLATGPNVSGEQMTQALGALQNEVDLIPQRPFFRLCGTNQPLLSAEEVMSEAKARLDTLEWIYSDRETSDEDIQR